MKMRRLKLIAACLVSFSVAFWSLSSEADEPGSEDGLTRTITFKNNCSETVWIAFTPSFIPGNISNCSSNSDCKNGAPCIGNQCVYPVPQPIGGGGSTPWELSPQGQSSLQVELQPSASDPTKPSIMQYVANFGARTGCHWDDTSKQLICETGQCTTDANGACVGGMKNPSTHAEITLNQFQVDFYDMSFVNGVNIPIGMAPDEGEHGPVLPWEGLNTVFWCGHSGFKQANPTGFSPLDCNWSFTPPTTPQLYSGYDNSIFYTVVRYNKDSQECTSNAQCDNEVGERCGFSLADFESNITGTPHCGIPLAYTVMANVCGSPYNQGAILAKQAFGCYPDPKDKAAQANAYKMQAYAMCAIPPDEGIDGSIIMTTPPPTCYTTDDKFKEEGYAEKCCGCIHWETKLPALKLDPNEYCNVTKDNFWKENIQNKVEWLSTSCPAGYAYQYDDVHSTFTCSSEPMNVPIPTKPNLLNYTVTFCPDGQRLFKK